MNFAPEDPRIGNETHQFLGCEITYPVPKPQCNNIEVAREQRTVAEFLMFG